MREQEDKPMKDEDDEWLRVLRGMPPREGADEASVREAAYLRRALQERRDERNARPDAEHVEALKKRLREEGVLPSHQSVSTTGHGGRGIWVAGLALAASAAMVALLLPSTVMPPADIDDVLSPKSLVLPQQVHHDEPPAYVAGLRESLGEAVSDWRVIDQPDGSLRLNATLVDTSVARDVLQGRGLVWPQGGTLVLRIAP